MDIFLDCQINKSLKVSFIEKVYRYNVKNKQFKSLWKNNFTVTFLNEYSIEYIKNIVTILIKIPKLIWKYWAEQHELKQYRDDYVTNIVLEPFKDYCK